LKVAAYQAPLAAITSMNVIDLIRAQLDWCATNGVEILCCPEAAIGGLADYASNTAHIGIDVAAGQLDILLAPLASDQVTTIIGFTETDHSRRLFNSAAVWHRGSTLGIYRKLHPAINKSIYTAGDLMPVFTVGGLTFGIIICNDSNYPEPARIMAAQGATALFVPTNNGLSPAKAGRELRDQTRTVDIALAIENKVAIIRADVAGRTETLVSYGSTQIVDRNGAVLQSARQLVPDLVVAEI
jgi:predicted amidohydrolase